MNISSYEDLINIDNELASLFLRPDEAVNWIYTVENGIKDWIDKHNKQYWEIVRYVSEQRGILGKLKKDRKTIRLTRVDFARVLLKFCPDAIKDGETVSALKSSMEHYEYMDDLRNLNMMGSGRVVRQHIKDVENLLDQKPIIELQKEESKPTLEDILEKYLRREVDEEKTYGFPRSKVCIRPQYDRISPAISVETYYSEKFLKEHLPSQIVAYELVDDVLQESKLDELYGKYCNKTMKLFIVSSFGLLPNIRALATDRGIGYIRINPNSKMTSENYILPRSIEDNTKYQHDLGVISGSKPMKTPLLIMDNVGVTSSLTDVLNDNGVEVKKHRLLNIPFLPNDEIEKCANEITKMDVDIKIHKFKPFSIPNKDFSINPFDYADLYGVSYCTELFEDDFQLGRLDVDKNQIILNSKGVNNSSRYRFTMAHELGHYILHSHLFKEQGVTSIGESDETLSISKNVSRKLEYQANSFASYLLMPKDLVLFLFYHIHDICIHKVYGDSFQPLYYNPDQPETWSSYNCVVGEMTRLLGVSQQALQIRLKSLNLLRMP